MHVITDVLVETGVHEGLPVKQIAEFAALQPTVLDDGHIALLTKLAVAVGSRGAATDATDEINILTTQARKNLAASPAVLERTVRSCVARYQG